MFSFYYTISSLCAPFEISMNLSETREISFSRILSKGITFTPATSGVNVYQFSEKQSLITSPSNLVNEDSKSLTIYDDFYYAYYLNEGSKIEIEFSSTNGVWLYLIKGDYYFILWDDYRERYLKSEKYSSNDQTVTFSYTITSADSYYIIFYNDDGRKNSDVTFKITLTETEYDFGDAEPLCSSGFSVCKVYYGSKYVYLQAPSDDRRRMIDIDSIASKRTNGENEQLIPYDSNKGQHGGSLRSFQSKKRIPLRKLASDTYDIIIQANVRWYAIILIFLAPPVIIPGILLCVVLCVTLGDRSLFFRRYEVMIISMHCDYNFA